LHVSGWRQRCATMPEFPDGATTCPHQNLKCAPDNNLNPPRPERSQDPSGQAASICSLPACLCLPYIPGRVSSPSTSSASISHHRCGGRLCEILPPGTAFLFDRPLSQAFLVRPPPMDASNITSFTSPLANVDLKLPTGQSSGVLAKSLNGLNGWTIALTIFLLLVTYDQCAPTPPNPGAPEADG